VDDSTPVLIYDGDCGFCTSSANWVAGRWRLPARAVPWQRVGADELARYGLSAAQVRSVVWWIDARGRRFGAHVAIGEALKAGSGWSALVGRLSLLPPFRWLGAALYPVISHWRHRLPGGTPACRT
jgi:predicted DCC family thiol-disulfide oxidoreductase YuxK